MCERDTSSKEFAKNRLASKSRGHLWPGGVALSHPLLTSSSSVLPFSSRGGEAFSDQGPHSLLSNLPRATYQQGVEPEGKVGGAKYANFYTSKHYQSSRMHSTQVNTWGLKKVRV